MSDYRLIYRAFHEAYLNRRGSILAKHLTPTSKTFTALAYSTTPEKKLRDIWGEVFPNRVFSPCYSEQEAKAWVDVFAAWFEVAWAVERGHGRGRADWVAAYDAMAEMAGHIIRGFQNMSWPNWLLPVLYSACTNLRVFAIKADQYLVRMTPDKPDRWEKLEDAARLINRAFTICLGDRASLEDSKKWGVYFMATIMFKTYFKLNSIPLCKNVQRALTAQKSDLPSFEDFPRSHRVPYLYFTGMIYFLDSKYEEAEKFLSDAFEMCHPDSIHNQTLILTHLIPCRLASQKAVPSAAFLSRYPELYRLYYGVLSAIQHGNLKEFDEALEASEEDLVKKRVFLTLERGRQICLRNVLRKTWKNLDLEDNTRVPIEAFRVGIALRSGLPVDQVDVEEVECLLTNMISNNYMKGYVSHERATVVLSAKDPFPGTPI